VLFKPFRVDQLLDTVEKVLARAPALVAEGGDSAGTLKQPHEG
jgi:hypothetical protein